MGKLWASQRWLVRLRKMEPGSCWSRSPLRWPNKWARQQRGLRGYDGRRHGLMAAHELIGTMTSLSTIVLAGIPWHFYLAAAMAFSRFTPFW